MDIIKTVLLLLAAVVESVCINELAGILTVKAEEKRNLDYFKSEQPYIAVKNIFIVLCATGIALSTDNTVWLIFSFSMLLCIDIIMMTDFRHRIIPNRVLLIMIVIKILLTIPGIFGVKGFLPFSSSVIIESLTGLIFLGILFLVPAFTTGNMGLGDVKMAGTIGFCLGLSLGLAAVIMCGFLVLIYLISQPYIFASAKLTSINYRLKQMIPLGVALGAASMIVLIIHINYPISISAVISSGILS